MNPAKPITIINDPLIFTQSDMHVSNFAVDKCGNMMLFDFGRIGRLPLSFAKYTMQSYIDDSFIARVAKLLSWPDNSSPNSNMRSMAKVAGCLWRAADPELGATPCALIGSKTNSRHRPGKGWPAPAKEGESSGVGDKFLFQHLGDPVRLAPFLKLIWCISASSRPAIVLLRQA
jgi:hypothetical protein